MELTYKRATMDDLDLLTETRVLVLKAVYGVTDDADMAEVREQSYDYYKKALAEDTHVAYLVLDGEKFVGAGGISFYRVMPTCDNVTGEKAYVMNMYTVPEYRRKGIAYKALDLLVTEAKSRGVISIGLDASDMGRLLYEKYGFVSAGDEMKLPPMGMASGCDTVRCCCCGGEK